MGKKNNLPIDNATEAILKIPNALLASTVKSSPKLPIDPLDSEAIPSHHKSIANLR